MKVICIHDGIGEPSFPFGAVPKKMPPIFVGSIYTVIDTSSYNGRMFYNFSEISENGYLWWYDIRLFMPLSDIDETGFERDYNKVQK